ncbi:hypothetical protein ACQPX6_13375 [Actinomycetospora sp. CA-101289]|uniref:hypothetical protein n=1 Tax=Actinomycetospora sp. CA-101289 TaxID=3239893 RepID=UPI003D978083
MEPTPIFAALVAPPARGTAHDGARDGQGAQRRTVTEILRALHAEDRDVAAPVTTGRVGHVPGVLSFRPSSRV